MDTKHLHSPNVHTYISSIVHASCRGLFSDPHFMSLPYMAWFVWDYSKACILLLPHLLQHCPGEGGIVPAGQSSSGHLTVWHTLKLSISKHNKIIGQVHAYWSYHRLDTFTSIMGTYTVSKYIIQLLLLITCKLYCIMDTSIHDCI